VLLAAAGRPLLQVMGLIVSQNQNDLWARNAPIVGPLPTADAIFTRVWSPGGEAMANGFWLTSRIGPGVPSSVF
jgi:hypothetical protein